MNVRRRSIASGSHRSSLIRGNDDEVARGTFQSTWRRRCDVCSHLHPSSRDRRANQFGTGGVGGGGNSIHSWYAATAIPAQNEVLLSRLMHQANSIAPLTMHNCSRVHCAQYGGGAAHQGVVGSHADCLSSASDPPAPAPPLSPPPPPLNPSSSCRPLGSMRLTGSLCT